MSEQAKGFERVEPPDTFGRRKYFTPFKSDEITKSNVADIVHIKLERTVKIGEIEYNIFIDSNQLNAELIPVDTPFMFSSDLTSLINKKIDFEINKEANKIISIVYET